MRGYGPAKPERCDGPLGLILCDVSRDAVGVPAEGGGRSSALAAMDKVTTRPGLARARLCGQALFGSGEGQSYKFLLFK